MRESVPIRFFEGDDRGNSEKNEIEGKKVHDKKMNKGKRTRT
jgi:hypothetical protein